MGVTNQTWGVTSAIVQALVPQYQIDDADHPVTSAHFAVLLTMCSSTVNGHLVQAGFDLATIADATGSVAYLRAQSMTARLVGCWALRGTQAVESEYAEALCAEVVAELDAIIADPSLLGEGASTPAGSVWTTTQGLGLDTTETARAKRRVFDDVRERTSADDDKHHW